MQWWNAQRLKSTNPKARLAVIAKIAIAPSSEDVPLLLKVINDPDAFVRRGAIRVLGKLKAHEAIRPLLQALRDNDSEVREEAVIALREIGDPQTADYVVCLLEDRNPGVRSQAALALERFRWQPRNDQERILRDAAVGRFVSASDLGPNALNIVNKTLSDGSATTRLNAVDALGKIGGEEVIPSLLTALKDAECSVRVAALEALKSICDPRALQPVTACLKHQEPTVRAAAVHALLPYGAQAIPALQRCLNDRHWSVRKAVVETLGRTLDASLVEALLPLLRDPDHDVREATCEALSRIKSRTAITGLVLALTDSQTSVRQYAAAALREIAADWDTLPEAQAALPQLQASLKDREYWVRQSAREAIKRIESAGPCAPEMPVPDEKLNAAFNVLVGLLKKGHPDLRLAAAEALGRFESPELGGVLSGALPDEDKFVTEALEASLRKCTGTGLKTPETNSTLAPALEMM